MPCFHVVAYVVLWSVLVWRQDVFWLSFVILCVKRSSNCECVFVGVHDLLILVAPQQKQLLYGR